MVCSAVANMLDSDFVICKFELHSRDYVQFRINNLGKGMSPLFPPVMGWIALLLSFCK